MVVKKAAAIWTTKEGTKIPIAEMGDRHLLNTIRFIERNVIELQTQTPSLRGIPLEALAIKLVPVFPDMLKEVKRRVVAKKQNGLFDEIKTLLADTPFVSPRKKPRRGQVKIRLPEPQPASRVTRKIILRD